MSANPHLKQKDYTDDPNYAWLEKIRQTFKQLANSPDPAILQGIIAEGLVRIKNAPPVDPLLVGYLRLTVAEAYMDLALGQEDQKNIRDGLAKGKQLCKKAAEAALKAGCGVAANILPRAITLLAALYKALPDMRQSDLVKSLQDLSDRLDEVLIEQSILRRQALNLSQNAYLILASFEGLSLEDRRSLLTLAAQKMLKAGDVYLHAGDIENVAHVQTDLDAIQQSLNNPDLPQPQLGVFKRSVNKNDLLPDVALHQSTELRHGEVDSETSLAVADDQVLKPKHKSTLRWVISIMGLIFSCLTSLYSSFNLYTSLTDRQINLKEIEVGNSVEKGQEIGVENLEETAQVLVTQMAQTSQANIQAMPEAALPLQSTVMPPSNQLETDPQSSNLELNLTGSQYLDKHSIVDDFSSEALDWPVYDDGKTILKYENENYSIQLKDPGKFDWVYFPVNFFPSEISFDVVSPQSLQDGTFGIFCQYQDEKNNFYIEIDLMLGEYTIFQNRGGENIPLTAVNEKGQYWHPAQSIKPAAETNHFDIGCYPGMIYLMINNEIIDEVTAEQPFVEKGKTAFIIYTFDFASPDGYKVFIDNVEAYEPMQ